MAKKKHYHYTKNNSNKTDAAKNSLAQAQVARYSETQLMMSLSSLGLSETTCELLEKNKITKAADLVRRSEKDMYKVQGLNKRILFEIKDGLKKNGMALCPDPQKIETVKPVESKSNKAQDAPKANKSAEKPGAKDEQSKEEKKSKFGLVDRPSQKSTDKVQKPQKQQKQGSQKSEKQTETLKPGQWRKVLKGGKWGYSDGYKIVIPTEYDEIFAFKEGLASVEVKEKCGYINEQNEIVIPLDYDTAMSFSEGLAMVVKGDKCGYINKNNEVIIPFEYDAATPFEDGEAKVKKDGKWGTITPEGKITWI